MEMKALDFKKEFFDKGEKFINGGNRLDNDQYSYSEWLQVIDESNNAGSPETKFSHTFFIIRDDGKMIGIANIRHPLEGFYKNTGHIGYSVRPSEREKGYATEILRQMLKYAKKQGLTDIYLVCKKDNGASRKTIVKNNAKLNRTFANQEIEYEEYHVAL